MTEPNETSGPDKASGPEGAKGAKGAPDEAAEQGGAQVAGAGADSGTEPDSGTEAEPETALPESATVPAGWLPIGAEALFGKGARAEETYGLLTVDVPPGSWISTLRAARDDLDCRFFDWLSAVDEPGTGFRVCAHLVGLPRPATATTGGRPLRRLLLRTTVPHSAPVLTTATSVFAGAAWHERETHEMFGVDFTDHPGLTPLLLPDSFEGHPLRKDFVLAARVAKAWPGAVEPGESAHGGAPKRRQMLPPGVPDPNEWGPLKGQLPPVPSRPARGRAGRAGTAAGERPARRSRSASAGSASQREDQPTEAPTSEPQASDAPWREDRPSSRPSSGGSGGGSEARASEPRASEPRASDTEASASAPRTNRPPDDSGSTGPSGPPAEGGA